MPIAFAYRQCLSVAVAVALAVGGRAFGQDLAPAMKYQLPMTRTAHFSDLGKKVNVECNELYHLLLDRDSIMNAEKRKALLLKAKPLLLQYRADLRQLTVQDGNDPSMVKVADETDQQTTERLALLGDEETTKALAADVAGADTDKALQARCILLKNRWTLADGDPAKSGDVANDLEALDRAHPTSDALANLTVHLADLTVQPALRDRLQGLVADVMKTKQSPRIDKIRQIRDAAKQTKDSVGRPFVLTGTTADGKPFSTADMKGKVVLVDFWATWCGPCKQELPVIKRLYADYHDKGLEIVGVSNDFSLAALTKFTADNQMPWPQIVDADAMAKQTWSSVTLGHGVDALPRVIVIDRNGQLLDANATHTYQDVVAKAVAQ